MINKNKILDAMLNNGNDFIGAVEIEENKIKEKLEKVESEISVIHDNLKSKNKQKRKMIKDLKQLGEMKDNFNTKYKRIEENNLNTNGEENHF